MAFCTPLMKRVHQLWRYSREMAFIDLSVVAFCTPLMKRVHQLWRYSSEMAFIDSSVVAFCTPLMKRVHQLWQYSSEMAFIDSSVVAFCTPLSRFDHFIQYADNLYKRKEEWALYYRKETCVRANNTNNYAEAGMRILKENVFNRTKAYNLSAD